MQTIKTYSIQLFTGLYRWPGLFSVSALPDLVYVLVSVVSSAMQSAVKVKDWCVLERALRYTGREDADFRLCKGACALFQLRAFPQSHTGYCVFSGEFNDMF